MKKKTVITTEKREVWVVREGIPERDQPIDVSNAGAPLPADSFGIPEETQKEENNDQ